MRPPGSTLEINISPHLESLTLYRRTRLAESWKCTRHKYENIESLTIHTFIRVYERTSEIAD